MTQHRITPACAGKSPTAIPMVKKAKDHPRVCGEKFLRYLYLPQ